VHREREIISRDNGITDRVGVGAEGLDSIIELLLQRSARWLIRIECPTRLRYPRSIIRIAWSSAWTPGNLLHDRVQRDGWPLRPVVIGERECLAL
jgi:hypothetical protein